MCIVPQLIKSADKIILEADPVLYTHSDYMSISFLRYFPDHFVDANDNIVPCRIQLLILIQAITEFVTGF